MDAPHPKIHLGEWAQARGQGNFTEAFKVTYQLLGEQQYLATIAHVPTGQLAKGKPCLGKKRAERDACANLLDLLKRGLLEHAVARCLHCGHPVTGLLE